MKVAIMKNINLRLAGNQNGLSLIGLIFMLAVLGAIAMIGMKVTPTVIEFYSIKNAIQTAKKAGGSVANIQAIFDKQAEIGYFDAISGKDLVISKNGDDVEISFAYEKKIPLVGPANLLLEYEGTTAKAGAAKKKQDQ
jgi:hypothetical protein